MKREVRILSYIFLFAFLCLSGNLMVKAASCANPLLVGPRPGTGGTSSIFNYNGGQPISGFQYITNGGDAAYCIDPEIKGPNSGWIEYCLEPVTESESLAAGVNSILGSGLSHEQIQTALRLFIYATDGLDHQNGGVYYYDINTPVYDVTGKAIASGTYVAGGTNMLSGPGMDAVIRVVQNAISAYGSASNSSGGNSSLPIYNGNVTASYDKKAKAIKIAGLVAGQTLTDVALGGNEFNKGEIIGTGETISIPVDLGSDCTYFDANYGWSTDGASSVYIGKGYRSNAGYQRLIIVGNVDGDAISKGIHLQICPGGELCCVDVIPPKFCEPDKDNTISYKESDFDLSCITKPNSTDIAGNGYQNTYNGTNNDYCKTYCLEDYDVTYPGASLKTPQPFRAGGYFELGNVKVNATRYCVSEIDYEIFEGNVKEYFGILSGARLEIENIVRENTLENYYNAWINEPEKTGTRTCEGIKSGNSCIDRDTGAYIDWTYGETENKQKAVLKEHYDKLVNQINELYNNVNKQQGNINDAIGQYKKCTNPSAEVENNPTIKYKYDDYYMSLMSDGEYVEASPVSINKNKNDNVDLCNIFNDGELGNVNYCHGSGNRYVTQNVSCSFTPPIDGKMSFSCEEDNEDVFLAKYAINSYNFNASYEIGKPFATYNPNGIVKQVSNCGDDANCQMINGGKSVFPIASTTKLGTYSYEFEFSGLGNYNDSRGKGRVSSIHDKMYENMVDPLKCEYEVERGIACETVISGGSGSSTGALYVFRPISLNDVFPNGKNDASQKSNLTESRYIGKNWITENARQVQVDIEEDGNTIYEEEPAYHFIMTAGQIRNLKAYNQYQENNGPGYFDFNLTCINGVNCTSAFLSGNGTTNDANINCQNGSCFTDCIKYPEKCKSN